MSSAKTHISEFILKCLTRISPTLNTKVQYRRCFHKSLDLNHPVTSNEKVLWLKLNTYYHNPLITQCADKYAVREYVKEKGCQNILNDLLGVWENPDEIDFNQLPNKFVLKSNYYYGMNLICTNKSKLDIPATRKELRNWMRSNGHLIASEMQYADIPKKIIAEKFIETEDGQAPVDYKVYCCNGKATYIMTCIGRAKNEKPKFYYFDTKGKLQRELTKDGLEAPKNFKYTIPDKWNEMIHYAEILSQPFPFVRADFYIENNQVIFGELTFTPSKGLDASKLPYTDKLIGDLIKLPTSAK